MSEREIKRESKKWKEWEVSPKIMKPTPDTSELIYFIHSSSLFHSLLYFYLLFFCIHCFSRSIGARGAALGIIFISSFLLRERCFYTTAYGIYVSPPRLSVWYMNYEEEMRIHCTLTGEEAPFLYSSPSSHSYYPCWVVLWNAIRKK